MVWVWCGAAGPRERTSENSTQTRFKLSSTGRVFFSVCLSVCLSVCPGTFQTARWPPFFIVAIDRGANSKVFDRGNFWNSISNVPGESFLISGALFEAISRNIAWRSYRKCILKLEIRKTVLQKVQKLHFWNPKSWTIKSAKKSLQNAKF